MSHGSVIKKLQEKGKPFTSLITYSNSWFSFYFPELGKQTFFLKVCKSQIRKVLGSFRYRKSGNFLGVPICKSKNRQIQQNAAQLCLKKVIFSNDFFILFFELENCMPNL
jgi:hypothetical protein